MLPVDYFEHTPPVEIKFSGFKVSGFNGVFANLKP
jgi:hypothetical protein